MNTQWIKNDSFLKLLWPLVVFGIILFFNMSFMPDFFHMETMDGHFFDSLHHHQKPLS